MFLEISIIQKDERALTISLHMTSHGMQKINRSRKKKSNICFNFLGIVYCIEIYFYNLNLQRKVYLFPFE